MSDFIHLRIKAEYSTLNSICKTDGVANKCKIYNQEGACLMDDVNLSGSFLFSKILTKSKLKPLLGLNIFLFSQEKNNILPLGSIGLIAKNENGYKNILKLLNIASQNLNTEQFEYAMININELRQYSKDVICISGGIDGILRTLINQNNPEYAQDYIDILNSTFKDNFYLEIVRAGLQNEKQFEEFILDQAYSKNIPIVATNDVRFMEKSQFEAYDVLRCVKNNEYVDDIRRARLNSNLHFKSSEEMKELFSDLPEAINNTIEIYKRCSFFIKSRPPSLPKFSQDKDELEIVTSEIENGLDEKIQDGQIELGQRDEYSKRAYFELDVIKNMGFIGYFLIVSDFIKWAKNNNIAVGPGRGSGAGSMIAWLLKITNIDPMKYGLLFERFLNPERVSMPDFDIDFCQENREKVIEYVKEKYGKEKVASIITYGKMQAKAVLKDVGRAMQIPYVRVDEICKLIPFNPLEPVTIEKALQMDAKLSEARLEDPDIQRLIDISLELEGLNRHSSTHAAGVIIADQDIINIAPVYVDKNSDIPILGYNMKDAESTGFVKFDFLGLKTLTIIQKTTELVEKTKGIKIDIDKIPLKDTTTFDLLKSGNLKGIFQLESAVPRQVLQKINTDRIEDIIAITSLNRPGPMENIPAYIRRKLEEEKPNYYFDCLEEELKETFGIIIYQEQVMNVARIVAGYSLAEADLLRRAMGKKIQEEMDKQKAVFVEKSVQKGLISANDAEKMFAIIEKFAGYGFNKSHAASYSLISYQTAYLKAHFPTEFLTTMMNVDIEDTDKIAEYVYDCANFGIEILSPDVNKSEPKFKIVNDKIQYGIVGIKGIGAKNITDIFNEKQTNGNFKDINDFITRTKDFINKKQLEALILSGSLDSLNSNRGMLFANVEKILSQKNTKQEAGFFAQASGIQLEEAEDFDEETKIQKEFEIFGFYLKNHPLSLYKKELKNLTIISKEDLEGLFSEGKSDEQNIVMTGVITKLVQRFKKGGRFAFVHFSDLTGIFETFLFNGDLIVEKDNLLKEGTCLAMLVNAKYNVDTGLRLLLKDFFDIKSITEPATKKTINDFSKQSKKNNTKSSNNYTKKETNQSFPQKIDKNPDKAFMNEIALNEVSGKKSPKIIIAQNSIELDNAITEIKHSQDGEFIIRTKKSEIFLSTLAKQKS